MEPLVGALAAAMLLAQSCPLCPADPGASVVHLEPAEALQAARALAAENEARLARIDALLRQGRLGPVGSASARQRAQLLARLWLQNVYSHLFDYAAQGERVVEADQASLAGVFSGFSEPGLFPLARLQRVRMGRWHVCAQYDLADLAQGSTSMGHLQLPYRVEDRVVGGETRRLLVVDWPSRSSGKTEVLLASHFGFRVERVRGHGPQGPYQAFAVEEVKGAWLRRWGVHRPDGFVFWTSALEAQPETLPGQPLVGVRIYIPGLRFELPVLPDLDLDDLRVLELPMPFLALASLREGRLPEWLEVDGRMCLKDWRGVGPVPDAVRQLFPSR